MANAKEEHHRILGALEREYLGSGPSFEEFMHVMLRIELEPMSHARAYFDTGSGITVSGLIVGCQVFNDVTLTGEDQLWNYRFEVDVLPLAVHTEDHRPGCPGCVTAEPPGSHEATCPVHELTVDLKVSQDFRVDYGLKTWRWSSCHGDEWKW